MREGEWVGVRYMCYAYYGYVQKVFEESGMFKLRIVKEISPGDITHYAEARYKNFGISQADMLEITCKEEDYASMIDLALMTGDEEWFNELVAKMNGTEYVQPSYYADGKAARNTIKEISDGFAALGKAVSKMFGVITNRVSKLVEIVERYSKENRERTNRRISCRKGWQVESDTRKQSQVLINKPKFYIRNLI